MRMRDGNGAGIERERSGREIERGRWEWIERISKRETQSCDHHLLLIVGVDSDNCNYV